MHGPSATAASAAIRTFLGLVLFAGWGSALAQVGLPQVADPLHRPLDPALERVDDRLSRLERRREALEDGADQAADGAGAADAADPAVETVEETAGKAAQAAGHLTGNAAKAVTGAVARALRPFALGADPSGWPVEQDIVVALLDEDQVGPATGRGLEVVAQRKLGAMGLVMVTLRNPPGVTLGQTIDDMRRDLPDAVVDFNHVYRLARDSGTAAATPKSVPDAHEASAAPASLRVGMIDSAVLAEHVALREIRVVGADFVTNEGRRPLQHGTAVASLLAESAGDGIEILSASVFFQTGNYAPGATTESLVATLDWLADERVDAINMSLSGPGNALLEKAVGKLLPDGPPIVAAVGNNGPSGEPLYPAAYAEVIAVTAVDRDGEIFLYSNRGDHVDYAALGVNVKVADSEGSWRLESGTSLASPHVSVVVARTMRTGDMTLESLQATLTRSAADLGRKGFDPIFGHGLISDAPVLVSRK